MNARNYLSLAALALLGLLAGCRRDDQAFRTARPADAVGINVTVGSLQATKSNPASTDFDEARLFNLGDQVCVSTDGQDPVLFECQNADQQTWAEAVPGKFLLWKQNEMSFKAYYPVTESTSMTAFTLPTDQSSVAKIALADYMTRQQTCSNESSTDIYLNLERKTARVIVRIAGFNNQYAGDEKSVSNVRIYSEASGIEDGNPTGSSTEIQPYAQGDGGQGSTYTALVVPGYGDDGADFITLTDGEGNTLRVKGIPELEAGNSYTFNLTVGKNTIQVQSVTVQDWTTGETLAGGQAQEQASALSLDLTSPVVGQVIGSDGKNYAYGSLPTGVTAVAKICYVSGSNGLALALTDEGYMDWSTAQTTCAAHTPAFIGGTWKLASKDEWNNMISAAGSYTALRDGFSSVGGTNMQSGNYWSSTEYEYNAEGAWYYYFDYGDWTDAYKDSEGNVARACLAFTVEAPSVTEVTTFSELQTALSAGKDVKLMNDIVCTAEIEITSGALTIDGNGKTLSTTSAIRAFKVGSSATVAFKNLTLTGFVSGGSPAINNNGGTIVLDGCTISNCHVSGGQGGGAIENKGGGKLYAINTTFSGNYSGEIGGAINNYGGSLYMSDCTFTDNYTTSSNAFYGGAIGINGGSEIRLINCAFSGNKYGTNTGNNDIGVYSKPTNDNYTIAGCTGVTIASGDGDITTNASGTATLDYSDLSNISFTYTPVTVTWNSPSFNGSTYTKDGVTLTPENSDAILGDNFYDKGDKTFTTTLGKFTKIEIVCRSTNFNGWTKETVGQFQPMPEIDPDYWEYIYKLTWTGNAESVTIPRKYVYYIQSITFTIL